MTGYQSMEGVPMTANRTLLRKVLKEEWGFEGLLVTDWNNVGTLVTGQKIAPDYKHAAKIAVEAGNDLIMSTPQFYQGCLDAVREGMLDEALIDEAVRRILSVKFRLGLFEDDRYPDPDAADRAAGTPEHRAAALTAARESLILLKNDGLLPVRNAKQVKVCLVGRMPTIRSTSAETGASAPVRPTSRNSIRAAAPSRRKTRSRRSSSSSTTPAKPT